MEERGVKDRVNTSQAYIWEHAVQYAVLPTSSLYTDVQVGDFVKFDSNGDLVRSQSGGAGVGTNEYRGIVVGLAPDSGEYPAFGAHFSEPLVALLSPYKTELIMRQIDNNGNYVLPSLKEGDATKFVYFATTKRWGVQPRVGTDTATGVVIQTLSDGRLLIAFGG